MYRIVKHGRYGRWFKIERRILFLWWTLDDYIDTYEEAFQSVELRRTCA